MSISFKQSNIVPGGRGGGKSRGKSTIIPCHYKSYEGGLKNEVSVIVPTNFCEDCSFLYLIWNRKLFKLEMNWDAEKLWCME